MRGAVRCDGIGFIAFLVPLFKCTSLIVWRRSVDSYHFLRRLAFLPLSFFINQITIPSVEDRNKALRLWLVWLGTLHAAYQDGVWTVSVAILARY